MYSLGKWLFLSWGGSFVGRNKKEVCKVAPLCLFSIWRMLRISFQIGFGFFSFSVPLKFPYSVIILFHFFFALLILFCCVTERDWGVMRVSFLIGLGFFSFFCPS